MDEVEKENHMSLIMVTYISLFGFSNLILTIPKLNTDYELRREKPYTLILRHGLTYIAYNYILIHSKGQILKERHEHYYQDNLLT